MTVKEMQRQISFQPKLEREDSFIRQQSEPVQAKSRSIATMRLSWGVLAPNKPTHDARLRCWLRIEAPDHCSTREVKGWVKGLHS